MLIIRVKYLYTSYTVPDTMLKDVQLMSSHLAYSHDIFSPVFTVDYLIFDKAMNAVTQSSFRFNQPANDVLGYTEERKARTHAPIIP